MNMFYTQSFNSKYKPTSNSPKALFVQQLMGIRWIVFNSLMEGSCNLISKRLGIEKNSNDKEAKFLAKRKLRISYKIPDTEIESQEELSYLEKIGETNIDQWIRKFKEIATLTMWNEKIQ